MTDLIILFILGFLLIINYKNSVEFFYLLKVYILKVYLTSKFAYSRWKHIENIILKVGETYTLHTAKREPRFSTDRRKRKVSDLKVRKAKLVKVVNRKVYENDKVIKEVPQYYVFSVKDEYGNESNLRLLAETIKTNWTITK